MILPELYVESKVNWKSNYSGIDSIEYCRDKLWFAQYKYADKITYKYNSRGFRDNEWPEDLKNAIWCIGDSFTVGIGSPIEHSWPYLLRMMTGIPTINIGVDGASNDLIASMSIAVQTQVLPIAVVHQWSYIHRREGQNERVHYAKVTEQEDVKNFVNAVVSTTKFGSTTVHSMIPSFEPSDEPSGSPNRLPDSDHPAKRGLQDLSIPNVVYVNRQLDYARDKHHYDIITATKYVSYYLDYLKSL